MANSGSFEEVDDDTFIDLNPGPVDSSLLDEQENHRSVAVWGGEINLKLLVKDGYGSYWKDFGLPGFEREFIIHPAIVAKIQELGFLSILLLGGMEIDNHLITAWVERWRLETHTFHLHVGEVTVTLPDVHIILGLPINGLPVTSHSKMGSYQDCCLLVQRLLGKMPIGPKDVDKGRLRINWILENFQALPLDDNGHYTVADLTYHTRAHMFLLIGSLLPDSSGNYFSLLYLELLEDLSRVPNYSWGSAVLAHLYRELCSACKKEKKQIAGCVMLLQVWVWEHFPTFAPVVRDNIPPYPCAMRWKGRLSFSSTVSHALLVFRYMLDNLPAEGVLWNPYDLLSVEWPVTFPLICFEKVEWHYANRVLRQYGFNQIIPSPPQENHKGLHKHKRGCGVRRDWAEAHAEYISLWDSRLSNTIFGLTRGADFVDGYMNWFWRITRRYLINPNHLSCHQRIFQGTRNYLPYVCSEIGSLYQLLNNPAVDPTMFVGGESPACRMLRYLLSDVGMGQHLVTREPRIKRPPPYVIDSPVRGRDRGRPVGGRGIRGGRSRATRDEFVASGQTSQPTFEQLGSSSVNLFSPAHNNPEQEVYMPDMSTPVMGDYFNTPVASSNPYEFFDEDDESLGRNFRTVSSILAKPTPQGPPRH